MAREQKNREKKLVHISVLGVDVSRLPLFGYSSLSSVSLLTSPPSFLPFSPSLPFLLPFFPLLSSFYLLFSPSKFAPLGSLDCVGDQERRRYSQLALLDQAPPDEPEHLGPLDCLGDQDHS